MDKIKYHNIVTVRSGDYQETTHNQMFPYFNHTVSGEIPCAYCRVGYDDGYIAVKTKIVAYDFNGESDENFCEYKATITDNDLPAGKSITSVGLAPNPTTDQTVNLATLEPVKKVAGENIEISVKITLNATFTNCTFTAGRNELIAVLLGASSFYGTTCKVAIGLNDHTLKPITRNSGQLELTREYGGFNISNDEIEFSLTTESQGDEMVVFLNDKSVLRGCYYGNARPSIAGATIGENNTATIMDRYLVGVTSITRNNGNTVGFTKRQLFGGATTDCEQIIDFAVPSGSFIIAEPRGYYFAVVDDKQVRVYKVLGREITHCYSVEREETEVALSPDGSIFFAGNKIVAQYYDGTTTTRAVIRNEPVTQLCVIYSDGCRRIGFMNAEYTYVCLYDYDGMIVAEDVYQMSYDTLATPLDGLNMIISSQNSETAIIGVSGTDYAFSNRINNYLDECGYYLNKIQCGWVELFDAIGERYLTHIYGLTTPVHIESGESYEYVSSEIALVHRNGVIERIIFNNLGSLSNVSAQNLNIPSPEHVISVGNYLLLKYGDSVQTLYLTRGGWRVKVLSASVGESVIASGLRYTGADWQPSNEYKLKIKLE